jgi:M6 family metalloprotease-like protein
MITHIIIWQVKQVGKWPAVNHKTPRRTTLNKHALPFLMGMTIGLAVVLLVTASPAQAAPMVGVPIQVTQPDGTILNCYATGDEYYNWMHDADGYTILQDHTNGYYVYADLVNGELVPTAYIPGMVDPKSVGLEPNLNISPEKVRSIRTTFNDLYNNAERPLPSAPTTGTINNLMIFIRFSGEPEFIDTVATYNAMLNNTAAGANSVRNYFSEVSYNQLAISSGLYPSPPSTTIVSYRDSHTRGYYQPYDLTTNPIGYTGGDNGAMRADREWTLLHDAIAYVNSLGQFPSGTSIDGDGDGYVDSVTFVIYGGSTGWASLLWPHAWYLVSHSIAINGKTVGGYNFQLQTSVGTGVLAHELFHVLGAPDLYHYSFDGLVPVGGWDVMEYNMNPPEHMGCYMKYKYGHWITSIPELTTPGIYSLNPLTSPTNNCLKIDSPNSTTEYFVVEYRRPGSSTFEASLPGTGMLVYRINPAYNGNANGDDEVYVYRPGGTITLNGNVNQANFSSTVGRTMINDTSDPYSFLTNGNPAGLDLCSIGNANSTISFSYASCTSPASFNKTSPANGAGGKFTGLTLDWGNSNRATSYDYCLDAEAGVPDSTCDTGWVTGLTASTVTVLGLSENTTYEWQVRANNDIGTIYANSGSYHTFSTGSFVLDELAFLPVVKQVGAVPAAFNKTSPLNIAYNISTNPVLDWATSTWATSYEYCYDNVANGTCSGTWTSSGSSSQVMLTGLSLSTTYEWQVKAINDSGETYANDGTLWRFTTSATSSSIIQEGFEGGVIPPTGWTRIITNEDDTWGISATEDANSGNYAAVVHWNYGQDEILFSPVFTTSGGTVAFSSAGSNYWCGGTLNNCDLEIWVVKDTWDAGAGNDVLLGLADPTWTNIATYALSSFNFTPYVSGGQTIKIAFRYNGNDGETVFLDDILITY